MTKNWLKWVKIRKKSFTKPIKSELLVFKERQERFLLSSKIAEERAKDFMIIFGAKAISKSPLPATLEIENIMLTL